MTLTLGMVRAHSLDSLCDKASEHYKKYFGRRVDFSDDDAIRSAMYRQNDELQSSSEILKVMTPVFIPKGLTTAEVFHAMHKQRIKTYVNPKDVNEKITHNVRTADRNYVIAVEKCAEIHETPFGDMNLGDRPEYDDEEYHGGMTYLERLAFGFQYHVSEKKHLDTATGTYCSASCTDKGEIPVVYFEPDFGEVSVNLRAPNDPPIARFGIRLVIA